MIKLIPVIDLEYYKKNDIDKLPNGAAFELPEEWDIYNQSCFETNGFFDLGKPYISGTTFYQLDTISEASLTKIVTTELNEAFEEERDFEYISAFSGGYILNIDGENILLPQCCCSLSDIKGWLELLDEEDYGLHRFWIGHPSPGIIKGEGTITFDLAQSNIQENYYFAPPQLQYTVLIEDLERALNEVKEELAAFGLRLQAINEKENLDVPHIEQYLVYGNYN